MRHLLEGEVIGKTVSESDAGRAEGSESRSLL
jgi:hypothetical protein